MKNRFGKTGIICLALVIALGTLGAGLAYWQETLTVNAVVDTGELDVGLKWYCGCETSPYVTLTPKCRWWWGDGVKSHTFFLDNVYPSFGSGCLFSQHHFCALYIAKNTGTIPAKVGELNIIKPDWIEVTTYSEGVPQESKDQAIAQIQASTEIPEEEKPDLIQAVEEDWNVGQLLTTSGCRRYAAIFLKLHILETAPEGGSGMVTVETIFTQFNGP